MSHEQYFELDNPMFDEAKALATCLEYLERCASEAGLYHCAKLINLGAAFIGHQNTSTRLLGSTPGGNATFLASRQDDPLGDYWNPSSNSRRTRCKTRSLSRIMRAWSVPHRPPSV